MNFHEIGFDSEGGQVLFHAAVTPKSDVITGGIDDLNPIELNKNEPEVDTPGRPLPAHIENLDRQAILNEGNFANNLEMLPV